MGDDPNDPNDADRFIYREGDLEILNPKPNKPKPKDPAPEEIDPFDLTEEELNKPLKT